MDQRFLKILRLRALSIRNPDSQTNQDSRYLNDHTVSDYKFNIGKEYFNKIFDCISMRVVNIIYSPSEKSSGKPSVSYTYFDRSSSKYKNISSFVNNINLQEWKYIICFIVSYLLYLWSSCKCLRDSRFHKWNFPTGGFRRFQILVSKFSNHGFGEYGFETEIRISNRSCPKNNRLYYLM